MIKSFQTSLKKIISSINYLCLSATLWKIIALYLFFCLNTEKSLSSLEISESEIHAIIKNIDSNESHGWDNLSIKMIKLCAKSITYPLKLIFEALLQEGTFPSCWKKS